MTSSFISSLYFIPIQVHNIMHASWLKTPFTTLLDSIGYIQVLCHTDKINILTETPIYRTKYPIMRFALRNTYKNNIHPYGLKCI